ncbi:MAG: PEP-CTERM sorting domain-containing protein [Pirellulales bacterium]|nr:PEP-CTERM sorting domain-containing protein [Pirellulales bacterium]
MKRTHFKLCVAFLLAAVVSAVGHPRAEAVIVATTTGNTTAPVDDFGFANVGIKGGATGVYLGYRWVLTAAHSLAADIVLNGRTYEWDEETNIRLKNPTDLELTEFTDLRLFRITEDPWLPTIKIADEPLNAWDEVVMVGNGRDRADVLTAWEVTGTYNSGDEWTWTVTAPPGDVQGYYSETYNTLRWGTNRVEPGMYAVKLSDTNQVLAFWTDFDQYNGTEFEAQATSGDSGGGVFHKNGDQWELVGIMSAVSDLPNQPSQALFELETYSADLSIYVDQILAIITPLGGDANLDGIVNARDAAIFAANWGRTDGVLWGHGDFNEDGVINQLDAIILADNWGQTQAPAGSQNADAVPEPSAIMLVLAGLIGLVARRVQPA